MPYFVGQDYPPIILETNLTISGGTVFRILYKKPSGKRGYWTATLDGTTRVAYTLSDDDLDESGTWKLQAYAEIGGGQAYGDEVNLIVKDSVQQQSDI